MSLGSLLGALIAGVCAAAAVVAAMVSRGARTEAARSYRSALIAARAAAGPNDHEAAIVALQLALGTPVFGADGDITGLEGPVLPAGCPFAVVDLALEYAGIGTAVRTTAREAAERWAGAQRAHRALHITIPDPGPDAAPAHRR